nr:putative F-box protein At3g52320 [Ipomoea batatas]GMD98822.1 putative F-box protein At3g52320 [Ipomoea batatas]GME03007.1 putative F-box protein At3g52320 [Ipomoea batatas]
MSALKKTASVSSLPQEILMEILSKIPAKSLVRFRCVSKFFRALIADHGFGVVHRSLSLTLPSRASFLISIEVRTRDGDDPPRRGYYTLNFSEQENLRCRRMLRANRVGFLDSEPFLLSSPSDGLICASKPNGDVAVRNVGTRQRIFLPRLNQYQGEDCALLLGFDSQSKRYKVLMSVQIVDEESILISYEYKHWVFTVGVDRSWREINNYCYCPFFPIGDYPHCDYNNTNVYIDGVIYSYNWRTDYSLVPSIVAFEVGCESFSRIILPDEITSRSSYLLFKKSALLEVGGRLAIVFVHVPDLLDILRGGECLCYMDVWTWEKSKKFWEKITITIPSAGSRLIHNAKWMRFATNHDGEIMLLLYTYSDNFSILIYNLKCEAWSKFDISGVEKFQIFSSWKVTLHNIVDHVFPLE